MSVIKTLGFIIEYAFSICNCLCICVYYSNPMGMFLNWNNKVP